MANSMKQNAAKIADNFWLVIKKIQTEIDESMLARAVFSQAKDLTLPQRHMILTIHKLGSTNINELAGFLQVKKSSVSVMVDKLVSMKLVSRRENKKDRRQVVLELKQKAKIAAIMVEKLISEKIVDLLKRLGPEMSEKWIQVSERLVAILSGEKGGSAWSFIKKKTGKGV